MCGIIAYAGKENAVPYIIEGLKKLEYRGYDSAGVAVACEGKITTVKKQGRVSVLEGACAHLMGSTGIGHTRWATHGIPSDNNAHPHTYGKFTLVHNGIVENFEELKASYPGNYTTDTDTEVIARIMDFYYEGDALSAIKKTCDLIKGRFALAVMCSDNPKLIYFARRGNPILAAKAKKAVMAASDTLAFTGKAKKAARIPDNGFAVIGVDTLKIYDNNLIAVDAPMHPIESETLKEVEDGETYMHKEILQIPETLHLTKRAFSRVKGLSNFVHMILWARKIYAVGCGTAYYSTLTAKNTFEKILRIPFETDIASEFRYKNPLIRQGDILFAVTQSGETTDTIAAAKLAKENGAYVAVVTNKLHSTITQYADIVIPALSGAEIGVAATKSYVAQVAAFALLAEKIADVQKKPFAKDIKKEFSLLPQKVSSVLASEIVIKNLAESYLNSKKTFYIGRGIDYAVALEGSLKLKEISYKHCEGYAAGELKHGTFALIDSSTLVIAIVTQKDIAEKTMNAVHEVKARNAKVILITSLKEYFDTPHADYVLKVAECMEAVSPIINVIPAQLFALYTSLALGLDPDKPRNLAKSVTVE
jgi:glucosamine--fructose-6-phosphate aminotransferase (isomerizing)